MGQLLEQCFREGRRESIQGLSLTGLRWEQGISSVCGKEGLSARADVRRLIRLVRGEVGVPV